MNLKQLLYFREVARTGSQTAAAERLHLSQPALGLQVRALEAEFGVSLFLRRSRGMELTQAGKVLLAQVDRVKDLMDEIADDMRGFARPSRRIVTLGAAPTPGRLLLPPLLRAVSEWGDIALVLHEDLSSELSADLQSGALDLALSYDPVPDTILECVALARDELILVGPPGRLSGGRVPVPFHDLPTFPLIMDSHKQITRRLLDEMAERNQVVLKTAMEVDSVNLKREVLISEQCFAIVPRGLFAEAIATGHFDWSPIVEPAVCRILQLSARRNFPPEDFARILDLVRIIVEDHVRSGAVNWHLLTSQTLGHGKREGASS